MVTIRKFAFITILLLFPILTFAQYSYGTTGLLNMPTADMQRDKTFMFGGNFLEKHTSTARWFYNTYNYYVNVTFFPWLEVAYDCTLHKAVRDDYGIGASGFWVEDTYGKYANQDRNFAIRLRLWKEGRWKSWTPQIVVGGNDAIHNSWEKGSKFGAVDSQTNGFLNRYYICITKHLDFKNIGQLGMHASYLYNIRKDYPLNGVAIGANFTLNLPDDGNKWIKALDGLNLMAEAYPADGRGFLYKDSFTATKNLDRGVSIGKYDINIGASYSIWKDHINFIGELYGCKDFSGGVQFKVHL
jgi:hypothetical protein